MEPGLDWDRWLGPAPKRPYNSVLSPRGVHKHFPNWRNYCEYSGGGMTDWGAHHFDIAQWGLGMDESGPVEIIPPANPKSGNGVKFVYDDGARLIHGGPGGVCFVGTNGVILVNRGRLEAIPNKLFDEPLKDKDFHLPEKKGSHHDDWVDCIKTREKPICDVEIGARSVTVCHLGNLAYWHGRTLKWDPKTWEFPGDAEANGWRTREYREPLRAAELLTHDTADSFRSPPPLRGRVRVRGIRTSPGPRSFPLNPNPLPQGERGQSDAVPESDIQRWASSGMLDRRSTCPAA